MGDDSDRMEEDYRLPGRQAMDSDANKLQANRLKDMRGRTKRLAGGEGGSGDGAEGGDDWTRIGPSQANDEWRRFYQAVREAVRQQR